jgi:hypothetical protein
MYEKTYGTDYTARMIGIVALYMALLALMVGVVLLVKWGGG